MVSPSRLPTAKTQDLYANGYKDKQLKTRLGMLPLKVPQTRDGAFYPQSLEKGLRSERALLLAIAEMYMQGVSTRRARGRVDSDKPLAPLNWAQRLKRVFGIDIEACPECCGALRVIARIEDPRLIAKILAHVRRREAVTAQAGARGPPDEMVVD